MSAAGTLQTGRLSLLPVSWADLDDLVRLKGDPRVFGQMLGGVRAPAAVLEEMAQDTVFWARHGCGMWTVREMAGKRVVGLVGLHERPDGRGIGLRFAFTPESRGHGLAREAASAALRFAHDRAGIDRVVAVAREANFGSRTVLGAIGMRECDAFDRDGERMLMYESVRRERPG